MALLGYSLKYAPDLSLVKYQALGDNNADGLIDRHNEFLRQWNRISVLAEARIHLIIQYLKENQPGDRMKFQLWVNAKHEEMLPSLNQLISACTQRSLIMKVTPRKAVAYIRTGSRSIGFVLPEEKELMQQFFNSTTMPHDNELIGKRCWLYYRADSSQFSPLPDLCEQGRELSDIILVLLLQ